MILRVLLLLSLFTALALVVTACAMPMRPVSSPATAPLAARVVVRWRGGGWWGGGANCASASTGSGRTRRRPT